MLPDSTRLEALEAATTVIRSLSGGSGSSLSESFRVQALQAATKLVRSLEKPEDGLMKFAYSMAIRTCVQLNAFSMLSKKESTSAGEIAESNGADVILIRRLLRVLTASDYIAEKGDGLYGPTQWIIHMQNRVTQGMIKFIYDQSMPAIAEGPKYFKETLYQNPTDPKSGLFQVAFRTDLPTFPWLTKPENKERWDDANTFFEGDRGSRPSCVSWFPVREKLLAGRQGNKDPLLVDVAGGRGHDLMEFLGQFPDEKGPFFLQDQQPVLDNATFLSVKAQKRAFDFFKESPVEGARIYFMKFIMHDYADEECLQILKNVKASMSKGYSYLVINDFILPNTGCPLLPAEWNLMMLILTSDMERTETQRSTLLHSAGLSVEGMYQPPGDGQGIIVAVFE
ncbi:hypothetical protein DL766_010360 [Monosporascus sp. MC13-8B]|uniref:O-methyltransferase domain-containing protein n=1 Tax=Monosporascus cannonballus TaxID=155416 RepID=A0ABY0GS17_9PEZI|nr:hypothetical protein DL762_009904 [Monosporascus cannonballus]RYO78054.1 hypothetical protein DL763_009790 [Monosporascus cannonballus]RYP02384.1 hypothetical protein DL766_010360 [Monosporascus sp. MC13-8B]